MHTIHQNIFVSLQIRECIKEVILLAKQLAMLEFIVPELKYAIAMIFKDNGITNALDSLPNKVASN